MDEFTVQRRGGKGVKCYKITEKTGDVVGVKAVNEENEVILITTEGIVIRLMVNDISLLGRITSGVKLISIDSDTDITVARLAKVRESNTITSDDDVIKNLEKELNEESIEVDMEEFEQDSEYEPVYLPEDHSLENLLNKIEEDTLEEEDKE